METVHQRVVRVLIAAGGLKEDGPIKVIEGRDGWIAVQYDGCPGIALVQLVEEDVKFYSAQLMST